MCLTEYYHYHVQFFMLHSKMHIVLVLCFMDHSISVPKQYTCTQTPWVLFIGYARSLPP